MDFDNLYKSAKTFLVFSIGVLIFSFSIKIWTGGGGYCKTSWKAKNYSCINDEGNIDDLLKDKDLPEDIKTLHRSNV